MFIMYAPLLLAKKLKKKTEINPTKKNRRQYNKYPTYRGALRKEVRLSYIRLSASYIASQWYTAMPCDIRLRRVFMANIISQKPQAFISLLLYGKNITANFSLQYHFDTPKKKYYFRQVFTFLKVCNHYGTFNR